MNSAASNVCLISCDSLSDLGVHNPSSDDALDSLDETKLYIDLKERFSFTRPPEPCYLHTTFSHLVSGYDAGYYAYIWSVSCSYWL